MRKSTLSQFAPTNTPRYGQLELDPPPRPSTRRFSGEFSTWGPPDKKSRRDYRDVLRESSTGRVLQSPYESTGPPSYSRREPDPAPTFPSRREQMSFRSGDSSSVNEMPQPSNPPAPRSPRRPSRRQDDASERLPIIFEVPESRNSPPVIGSDRRGSRPYR